MKSLPNLLLVQSHDEATRRNLEAMDQELDQSFAGGI
jgi:hypothetical protein